MTTHPNFFILYVENAARSAEFYSRLLGSPPVDATPAFVTFALNAQTALGLWTRDMVEPRTETRGGGNEVVFAVKDREAADSMFAVWSEQGIPMVQEPTKKPFGYTFVGVDPDAHRLRVFVPERPQ